MSLLTAYTLMLTLNSLKIQIRISKYYAITSSTSHINSRLLIASFLQLIQNFLHFYILGMKLSEFNLQYLEVGEAREKTFLKTVLRMLLEMLQIPFLLTLLTLNLKPKLSTFLSYPLTNIWFILCPFRSFLLQFSK